MERNLKAGKWDPLVPAVSQGMCSQDKEQTEVTAWVDKRSHCVLVPLFPVNTVNPVSASTSSPHPQPESVLNTHSTPVPTHFSSAQLLACISAILLKQLLP